MNPIVIIIKYAFIEILILLGLDSSWNVFLGNGYIN